MSPLLKTVPNLRDFFKDLSAAYSKIFKHSSKTLIASFLSKNSFYIIMTYFIKFDCGKKNFQF